MSLKSEYTVKRRKEWLVINDIILQSPLTFLLNFWNVLTRKSGRIPLETWVKNTQISDLGQHVLPNSSVPRVLPPCSLTPLKHWDLWASSITSMYFNFNSMHSTENIPSYWMSRIFFQPKLFHNRGRLGGGVGKKDSKKKFFLICLYYYNFFSFILSRVKQITSPGWMHETSARAWCTGKTQRIQVEREVGVGIGMGNTCKSMADSCQCMIPNFLKCQNLLFNSVRN